MQKIVALSTTEAEYISATKASKEAIWLTRISQDLGMSISTTIVGCDSQSAVYPAKNALFNSHIAHIKSIDVHYHFIKH